jgi:hypothetical protein
MNFSSYDLNFRSLYDESGFGLQSNWHNDCWGIVPFVN